MPWIRAHVRKHRGKDQDVDMTRNLDPWTIDTSENEMKSDLVSWFCKKPPSETSKDESSDAQSPSKASESTPDFVLWGQDIGKRFTESWKSIQPRQDAEVR